MGPENVADIEAVRMKIAAIVVAVEVVAVVEPKIVNMMLQLQEEVRKVCSLERMAVST